jgi:hypothetical protein
MAHKIMKDSFDFWKGKQPSQVHKKSTPNLTVLLSII